MITKPKSFRPSEETVKALQDEIYKEKMADGSGAWLALSALRNIDLIDLVRQELEECPNSPISIEIKKLLRVESRKEAEALIRQILTQE